MFNRILTIKFNKGRVKKVVKNSTKEGKGLATDDFPQKRKRNWINLYLNLYSSKNAYDE